MANPEDRIQAAIVDFVRTVAPQVRIHAIPNGGLRAKREAAKLKWTGVVAGVPDLAITIPGGLVAYIEVKAPRGSLSPEQREWRDWLNASRVPFALCRSIEDARAFLTDLNIATREAA